MATKERWHDFWQSVGITAAKTWLDCVWSVVCVGSLQFSTVCTVNVLIKLALCRPPARTLVASAGWFR